MQPKSVLMCLVGLLLLLVSSADAEMRTWTQTSGTKFEAEYVWRDHAVVTLRRADGTEFTVNMAKLSKEDRAYLVQQPKNAPPPVPAPATLPRAAFRQRAQAAQPVCVLELVAPPGVRTRVNVGYAGTGDRLLHEAASLDRFSGGTFPRLAVETAKDTFQLVSWCNVKEVVTRNVSQVVMLKDGREVPGKLKGWVTSQEDQVGPYEFAQATGLSPPSPFPHEAYVVVPGSVDPMIIAQAYARASADGYVTGRGGKVLRAPSGDTRVPVPAYDLSTATSVKVVQWPPRQVPPLPGFRPAPRNGEWKLTLSSAPLSAVTVVRPRFVIHYTAKTTITLANTPAFTQKWSPDDYPHETSTVEFCLTVGGQQLAADIDDFVLLDFRPGDLTVKTNNGGPMRGALGLFGKTKQGVHNASQWLLAADLADGSILALKNPICKLERK